MTAEREYPPRVTALDINSAPSYAEREWLRGMAERYPAEGAPDLAALKADLADKGIIDKPNPSP